LEERFEPSTPTKDVRKQKEMEIVGIFTDSLSNLETIEGGIAVTREQEVMLKAISNHPHSMVFHHVRAHRDNKKNIAVDKLCDVMRDLPGRATLDLSGAKTVEKINQWTKEWATDRRMTDIIRKRMRRSTEYHPSVTQTWIRRKLLDNKSNKMIPRPQIQNELPRRQGILMAKARINNWTSCCHYLHKIKAEEYPNPNCTCKSITRRAKAETMEHLVDHCNKYDTQRELMLARLRKAGKISNLSTEVTDMLTSSDKYVVDQLGKFLVEIDDEWKKGDAENKEKKKAEQQVAKTSQHSGNEAQRRV
jgi:hypothetical protein